MRWKGLLVAAGVLTLSWVACDELKGSRASEPAASRLDSTMPKEPVPESQTLQLKVKVVSTRSHDKTAYTQGLLLKDGELFESTGQYGESSLRRVDPGTGEVKQLRELPGNLFGEGLEAVGERLIQLTWQAGTALIYDAAELTPQGSYGYEGEGWGLCFDGRRLFMSDGSDVLTVRDPETFAVLDRLAVTRDGRPQGGLNELECAEGQVYANVYYTDFIVRIDPLSGQVTAVVDASGLLAPEEASLVGVLNGIAYDPDRGTFLLTGKYWPQLFEVVFAEEEN